MSEETLRQSIDFFASYAQSVQHQVLNVTFFGGEPLLQKDLMQSGLAYLRERYGQHFRIHPAINTNGTLINEEVADYFQKERFRVFYSLDGIQQSHDRHRMYSSGKGSWESVVQGMRLIESNLLAVIRVVTPQTMNTLTQDLELFLSENVRNIAFAPEYSSPSSPSSIWTQESLDALRLEYEKLGKLYLQEIEAGRPIYLNLFSDKIRHDVQGSSCKETTCSVGQSVFAVNPHGQFFPCTRFLSTSENAAYQLGDVQLGFLAEAMAEIERYHAADREFCSDCQDKDRCAGNGCACTAFSTLGSLFGEPDAAVCAHERILMELADSLTSEMLA